MNGNERRWTDLYHPENSLTQNEINNRKEIVKDIFGIVNGISMSIMVLGAIIVAYGATRYMGYTGLYIAFFGTLLDIGLGAFIAYHLGNKMQKLYTEKYLNNNVV